jgi:hypothetical protein
MIKTIYLNLEDDIGKITSKLKREKAPEVVLVFPKKSFLFSDSINLRLLKKQVEMLGKKVYVLTMDEAGQMYAREAGFELKFLPKSVRPGQFSDIRHKPRPAPKAAAAVAAGALPRATSTVRAAVKKAVSVPARARSVFNLDKPPGDASPYNRRARKMLIGFVALALVLIIALVVVVLPRADITAYAKSQPISRDIDLSLDTKTQTADAAKLSMPAVAVDQTQDESNTFQTNGKNEVGTKSQGRVAIYNLTGSSLNLKATTTVLSVGSKNYTFNFDQENIHALPSPTQDQNATVADITAQGGGESFNLPAGTRLEITNQSFGSQPQRLYAKTVTQVVGGASRFVSVISKDDLAQAQKSLVQMLADKIRGDLKTQNLTLLDDAQTPTVSGFATDKPEGTETPSFNAKAGIHMQGLAFDQDQLVKLLRDRLSLSLSGDQALQDASQDTMTIKVKNLDLINGVLSLSIHYESKAIPQLDTSGVRQQIAGKSKQQAGEILLSNPNIERVDITLSPSWQASLPRLTGKIHLNVQK